MIGSGQRVDLLKLFWVVRKWGGFDSLSETGVWDLVGEESGLGLSLGWAVKLVYVKYLYLLERVIENKDLERLFSGVDGSGLDVGEHLMGLEDEFKFFSDTSNLKLKGRGCAQVELSPRSVKDSDEVGSAVAESDRITKTAVSDEFLGLDSSSMVNVLDAGKFCNGDVSLLGDGTKCSANLMNVNLDSAKSKVEVGKLSDDAEVKSEVGESGRGKKNDDCNEDVMILDPSTVQEVSSTRKRKRELFGSEVGELRRGKKNGSSDEEVTILDPSTVDEASSFCTWKQELLCGMLNWVRMIAQDPCGPAVGSLPERSKWKSFGNEEKWMQVLRAREAIFLKRHADSSTEQSSWQKNHRMHPSMYDDPCGSAYNFRERLRLEKKLLSGGTVSQSGACSESSSDLDKISPEMEGQLLGVSELDRYPPSRSRVGKNYQARLPEWTGKSSESDLKWVRTRIWPLEKPEKRFLIERDPIGKGRQESCGCEVPGSIGCVRFHISEKRLRVKQELGPAFYHWEFNLMGEDVGLPWTAEEEKKFKDIVKENPPSLGITFWDDIFESFAKKSRRDLVSYYFNVFLVHRRGHQNRFTPNNIDSDDEELESGSATNGCVNEEHKPSKSILKSPHKPQAKYR